MHVTPSLKNKIAFQHPPPPPPVPHSFQKFEKHTKIKKRANKWKIQSSTKVGVEEETQYTICSPLPDQ